VIECVLWFSLGKMALKDRGIPMKFDLEKTTARETYQLLIGLVAPRPIALVTSMDEDGRLNAAPFSSYNYLCTDPPIIGMGVLNRPSEKLRTQRYGKKHSAHRGVCGQRRDGGSCKTDEHLCNGLSS
jgi:hypothetical protein